MSTLQSKGPQRPLSAASDPPQPADPVAAHDPPVATPARPRELGGVPGPDPTRFGDWEKNGRCIDF